MNIQDRVRQYTKNSLQERQKRNSAYSMRSQAIQLGVSASSLSEFLSGKRSLGKKNLQQIVKALDISQAIKDELIKVILAQYEKNRLEKHNWTISKDNFILVKKEQSHLYRDWQYFAIMSLSNTEDFLGNSEFVSKRLGIDETEAQKYLNELFDTGLLVKNYRGEFISSKKELKSNDNIPSKDIREHHRQNLSLAENSLSNTDLEERDFTFMCFAYKPSDMPRMKEWIKKFRRDFLNEFENKKTTEIGRLCIQLFPLSKRDKQ